MGGPRCAFCVYFGTWSVDADLYDDAFRLAEDGLKSTVDTGTERLRALEYVDPTPFSGNLATGIEGYARGDDLTDIGRDLAINNIPVPGGRRGGKAKGSLGAKSPDITPNELTGKTRKQIRELADEKGLKPAGQTSHPDYPRKWKDPINNKERLRLDRGHIDKNTGLPYNNPNAACDHVHGYNPDGSKIPVNGDPHIPTTGEQ